MILKTQSDRSESSKSDGAPCGEGGASAASAVAARPLCGEGGASVCAPDSEGGASMVGDSVKNACCDNFPCALMPLFPPLLRYFRCGRVYIYAAWSYESATMDPMSRKSLILLSSSHNESTP